MNGELPPRNSVKIIYSAKDCFWVKSAVDAEACLQVHGAKSGPGPLAALRTNIFHRAV